MAAPSATALTAATVLDELARCGVTHIVWLPDSETGFMYQAMVKSDFTLVPVCREGEAVPIAAGLMAGGKQPVVLIQSTGFFESGDSVRGLALDLKLPLLIMIGYRGFAGHEANLTDSAARFLEPILNAWGIPYQLIRSDADCHAIFDMQERARRDGQPAAVLFGSEYAR
jgi:sulfopyruvate decarboxylase TPP-binding subunit